MARKHNVEEVLRSLSKKHDVKISQKEEVFILNQKLKESKNDLGNGSWGKISFLVNYTIVPVYQCNSYEAFLKIR